jgi:predicted membrane metal-binding protein
VVAGIVFVVSAICMVRKRTASPKVLALGALVAVGALSIQMRRSSASEQSLWFGSGEVQVTARVIAEGEIQSEGDSSFRQRVNIETEALESDSQTKKIAERIRLSVYQNDRGDARNQMRLFSYGERIRFRTTLVAPRNYRNPGAFDYAEYLRDKGVVAGASVKYSNIEVLPGFAGNRVESWRAAVHRGVIRKIHALWPERMAGLMDAIVVGEEAFIERPTRVESSGPGRITFWLYLE